VLEVAHILTAYLLGSVCFGLLFAKAKGVDLRAVGSGNIGATNAGRAMGLKVGRAVLALDMLKGALPTASALWIFHMDDDWVAATAIAATLGHLLPLWFGLRGGKGAATAGGAILAALPLAGVIAGTSFVVVKGITRHASAGSLAACVAALLVTFLSTGSFSLRGMVVVLVVLVVIRHHSNIRRLLGGQELDS